MQEGQKVPGEGKKWVNLSEYHLRSLSYGAEIHVELKCMTKNEQKMGELTEVFCDSYIISEVVKALICIQL